ncbi:ribose 5-phosphate isomerase B [Thorsellia anophelis]|uniref:Ribose 5-phosphate isomerase B n=1 Tax=Thorsellia anophelis DSM 18579 TaxID=1123402 RepID=A0A1I0AFF1_9GAMM|nr:ribose 5-phosphate isomerase B [Thorsellia anophelis]SES92410.1 ribose 5-phosphate isomerase B [Thorsellia anophelis DSM 18579]
MLKTIAIGADDAASTLKDIIINHIKAKGLEIVDYSESKTRNENDYPDIAFELATAIKSGLHDRGILLCGTGIGMSIVANKVNGVRCAQCHDTYSAQRARKSNNAQVISLGARVIGPELAKEIINEWLLSEFEGGGSAPKVEKISKYEQKI